MHNRFLNGVLLIWNIFVNFTFAEFVREIERNNNNNNSHLVSTPTDDNFHVPYGWRPKRQPNAIYLYSHIKRIVHNIKVG